MTLGSFVSVKIRSPKKDTEVRVTKALIYSDQLVDGIKLNERTEQN